MEDNKVFALDIGTRKIVGLIMEKSGDQYQVLDAEMLEHSTRAMVDGQIHDVEAVAATILRIKEALESRLGVVLESASVAAAGRSLKTVRGHCLKSRLHLNEISNDEERALEIEAVKEAEYKLAQAELAEKTRENYFCVGYSVVSYYLEGQAISKLVGQVGAEIGVEVVATFLPRVVVDSLFSALKRAGLQVNSLTLEPIAALSVAIPPSVRLLNLALVDVGAGTSDIALVKEGKIFGYAMVPIAGDELTECLASHYLLDFATAEKVKRSMVTEEQVEFADILGNRLKVSSQELAEKLRPLLEDMTSQIALNITALNEKLPDAVVCVGGGSITPGLTTILAEKLGIVPQRVGIRTVQNLGSIKTDFDFLTGPQGITPLGIAYNYFTLPPVSFIKVSVNGRQTALWNIGELNVATALLSSGISLTNIFGKPGMGKTIEVNGKVKIIKGTLGTPPVIKVNGEPASLETALSNGDNIEFVPGQDGQEASITGRELVSAIEGQVKVNGEYYPFEPVMLVNGKTFDLEQEIPDRAQVNFKNVNSVHNILRLSGVDEYWLKERVYTYYLDDRPITVNWLALEVKVNGKEATLEQEIEPGASITYSRRPIRPCVHNIIEKLNIKGINVRVNGKPVQIERNDLSIEIDGKPATRDDELPDNARISIRREETGAILSDIFRYIDVKPLADSRLLLKVNGEEAGFTTPLREGSEIEIYWE